MTKDIYILVGPPASGKTTWIQKEFQGECHVISSDYWLEQIAIVEKTTYDGAFKYIKVADRLMWEEFDKVVSEGHTPIVVDRTNMSIKSRQRFFDRLRNFHKGHGYRIHAVVFSKPDDDEYERRLNSRPGKTIPEAVVSGMLASYQPPTEAEGFATVQNIG